MEESEMARKTLGNWMSLAGVAAFIAYFLHVGVGQALYPGYDWMRQAVSDLTAAGSPSSTIASRFTLAYGILACVGCAGVCLAGRRLASGSARLGLYLFTVMNFVSAFGYGLFPLSASGYAGTFQDIMHLYVVTGSVVLLSIVSLILLIVGGIRLRILHLSITAAATLGSMMAGALGTALVSKGYFGLMERFSVFAAVFFTGYLGIVGLMLADQDRMPKASRAAQVPGEPRA
jgi:hypothetical protein